jgi:hypothetical protein
VGEGAAGTRAEDEVGISAAAGSLLGGQLIDEDVPLTPLEPFDESLED